MNIIHISTRCSWGGGEKQVWYLLNELQKKDVQQTLICARDSVLSKKAKAEKFRVVELPRGPLFTLRWALQLQKYLNASSILHTHDGQAHNLAVLHDLFSKNKVPIVVHRRIIKNAANPYQRWKFNRCSIRNIICISSAVRNSLLPVVANHNKLVLIPSGIDMSKKASPSLSKESLKAQHGIPANCKLIVNIGSLVHQKHPMTFLGAARIFLEQYLADDPVCFALLGEGPLRAELEHFIENNKLSERCFLLGFTSLAEEVLAVSDILVSTSVDEALGNVIMEAFLLGIPVVATNSGGIPDLIIHNKTGLLVEPLAEEAFAKSCALLLNNAADTNRMRRNAFEKLSEFSIVKSAELINKIYTSIEETMER